MPPGFKRHELKARYDVAAMGEDAWHAYSGKRTAQIIAGQLSRWNSDSFWLMNAGAGVYEIGAGPWKEIFVDLFASPIQGRLFSVCASIERLPFPPETFGGIVCVGEVLAYCDPAAAICEFARVVVPHGLLICDFASSRSARHWLRSQYGRAADLVTDHYNGTPEKTWIYDPNYVTSLLVSSGFEITRTLGTHTLSSLARRIGARSATATYLQERLEWLHLPKRWADLMTIVAVRSAS